MKKSKLLDVFPLFIPTAESLRKLEGVLLNERFNLSDEYRNIGSVRNLIMHYFTHPANLFYDINGKGVLGFTYITSNHKCTLSFKMFDKNVFTHNTIKKVNKLINTVMDEFQLIKINAESADLRIVEIIRRFFSFKGEGLKEKEFSWNGELYDLFLLAKLREG